MVALTVKEKIYCYEARKKLSLTSNGMRQRDAAGQRHIGLRRLQAPHSVFL